MRLFPLKNNPTENLPNTFMSLGDHLDDLRRRILRSLYGLVVTCIFCFFFGKDILGFIAQPMLLVMQANGLEPEVYVSTLPEAFNTYMKVSLYSGVFLASPWIFWQLWKFIAVGLYPQERRMVHIFVPFSAILFILGSLFFVFMIAPLTFNFFITFGSDWQMPDLNHTNPLTQRIMQLVADKSPVMLPDPNAAVPGGDIHAAVQLKKPMLKPLFTLQKYVSLVVVLGLMFGLAFQTPLIVFFLGRISILKLKTLQSTRKYAIFIITILAAILTPSPDIISQLAMGIPMYMLYEMGILMLRLWPGKSRQRAQDQETPA